MTDTSEKTRVAIIGAGVAGLTLGNLLIRNGVDCIVLERRSRAYVEQRQRAGTVDSSGARIFHEWGLADVLDSDAPDEVEGGIWIDGHAIPLEFEEDDNADAAFIPQQVLVHNLTDAFLAVGGDLRYEIDDLALHDFYGDNPTVTYHDQRGTEWVVVGDYIAGCDGDRGVSRASIPDGVLTRYAHEYGYAWLTILADTASETSGTAIHSRGFAAMIPRGQAASRLYLQVPLTDILDDWPDERIWAEMDARYGEPVPHGPIVSKQLIPLRSVVYDPMQYGRLYLLGDAAHIVPPMNAKGIHLALHDAELFARAVIQQAKEGDGTLLEEYSDTALGHIWNYQAFAVWITDLMHNAGDTSHAGEFRKHTARAELQRQFASSAANKLFSELTAGLN